MSFSVCVGISALNCSHDFVYHHGFCYKIIQEGTHDDVRKICTRYGSDYDLAEPQNITTFLEFLPQTSEFYFIGAYILLVYPYTSRWFRTGTTVDDQLKEWKDRGW